MRTVSEFREAIRHMEEIRNSAIRLQTTDEQLAALASRSAESATGIIKALEWAMGDSDPNGFGAMLKDLNWIDEVFDEGGRSKIADLIDALAAEEEGQHEV